MTEREFYELVKIELFNRRDVVEICDKKLKKMDEKNKKAIEKRKASVDEIYNLVKATLTNEFQTLGDISVAISNEEVTLSKIISRLTKMADDNEIEKAEVNVPLYGNKKRKVMAYRLKEEK